MPADTTSSDKSASQNWPVGPPPYGYWRSDEIDLKALFITLYSQKWLVIGIVMLISLIAVAIALTRPVMYRAEAVLALASQDSAGFSLPQGIASMASLAGIEPGGSEGASKKSVAMATLQSHAFIVAFIHRHHIEVPLMGTAGWDKEYKQWVIDESLYDSTNEKWVREVKPGRTSEPSDWELYEAFSEKLGIEEDQETGLVSLSIESESPQAASQWVEWLVQDVNEHMRNNELQRISKNIAYLKKYIQKTRLTEMQRVLYNLVEKQEQQRMLAAVDKEYVFRTIDPPVVPEDRVRPNRKLIAVIGGLLGIVLAVIIAVVRQELRKQLAASKSTYKDSIV